MAFNDALLVVTIGLIVSAIAVWFCSKGTMEAAGAAGVSIDCRCQKLSKEGHNPAFPIRGQIDAKSDTQKYNLRYFARRAFTLMLRLNN
jgi:hypothetical protein